MMLKAEAVLMTMTGADVGVVVAWLVVTVGVDNLNGGYASG